MTHLPINPDASPSETSYEGFELSLIRALGTTVGGSELSRALGYPTQEAFRKAYQRGRLPIATFSLAGRRGRFAAVPDIARWIWLQRSNESNKCAMSTGGVQ